MKKNLLAAILAAAMLATAAPATVFADDTQTETQIPEKVEISFCVGDETLLINGNSVTVEKPYVVGAGVTLVPLRVITEAFGSTVEWIGETKTINITYPDVAIVLQIGNPIAEVNGIQETLLSAPELTPNGFTMVPLRFISETFGATVSYDEATKRITVIKETDTEEGPTVEVGVTNKFIGDSYYNWSIENSSDMIMTDRAFDGTTVMFDFDENNGFLIDIGLVDESEYDIEAEYEDSKYYLSDYTLVKAETDFETAGKKSYELHAKNKSIYIVIREIVANGYYYYITAVFGNDDTEKRDKYLRLVSTFDTNYDATADIHDLSDIKDGMRSFEAENLGLSFDVPANFVLTSDEDSENIFDFSSIDPADDYSTIHVTVYSKGDGIESAESYAKTYVELTAKYINKNIVTVTDVKPETIAGIEGYTSGLNIKKGSINVIEKDFCFEIGNYVYDFSVVFKAENEAEFNEKCSRVLNSIKAESIDQTEVGMFLLNDVRFDNGTKEISILGKTAVVSKAVNGSSNKNQAAFINERVGYTLMGVYDNSTTYNRNHIQAIVQNAFKSTETDTVTTIITPTPKNIGDVQMWHAKAKISSTNSDFDAFMEIYAYIDNGALYLFSIMYSEINDCAETSADIKAFMEAIQF